MLHSRLKIVVAIVLCLAAAACSTKRNTWVSRNYQTLISKYNVYYNGQKAFDDGVDKVRAGYNDDYSHVLPVYEFSNESAARSASGDMETALKKGHKLIQLHSITVKPKRKDKRTDKYKRFYAQEEFNPYVRAAYLLLGKANVVKHENDEAIEYFDYLARKYEGTPECYEGRIWKSIAYAQLGQLGNAQSALESYDMDGLAPAGLYPDYMAAQANLMILQKKYAEAIPYMKAAAEETPTRNRRRRYKYILAQLYRQTGQNALSAPLFLELSRGAADYDMAFAAKMDLATVATSAEELAQAEKMLEKMSGDAKNKDQLDQIYYSLGKLDEGRGELPQAERHYLQSVGASVANDNQKGLSYLALADIYLARPQYIEGSMSADSAAFFLDDTNPRKAETVRKAATLAPLAQELNTIKTQDSLLRIANMDSRERDRFIKNILDEIERERRAKEEARLAEAQQAMSQSEYYQLTGSTTGMQRTGNNTQWYFYNTNLVNAGKSTFVGKWGRRKNEDNWRRSNKSSMDMSDMESQFGPDAPADGGQTDTQADGQAPADGGQQTVTRESLMAGLPLTDADKEQANGQIRAALFNSGAILYDDIRDYPSAIGQLTALLDRYPQCPERYDALVMLHFAQTKQGDAQGAAATADAIRRGFPQSSYAQYLSTPDYFDRQKALLAEKEYRYEDAYHDYLGGNYAQAAAKATQALADTANAAYAPKYLLVRSLAYAKQAQRQAFHADLLAITERYAGTEEDSLARKLLAKLDEGLAPVKATPYVSPLAEAGKHAATTEVKTETYEFRPDTTHSVVCLVDDGMQNRAQFVIADFNFSNYLLDDFDLRITALADKRPAIVISGFADAQAAMTYYYALREQGFWKEVSAAPLPGIYAVSDNNLRLVLMMALEAYPPFFEENYLKNQP